uniref:WD repeat-containing protein 46 n=1 Tax=Callorhinchus milii TaxID=7868 RepID=A0A4W3GVF2_CALMI|eukprot:gi/632985695/ref/XP_007909828.1/ PREDICTED: WD repeat-containing protein 46 [Callorhinchus milii]
MAAIRGETRVKRQKAKRYWDSTGNESEDVGAGKKICSEQREAKGTKADRPSIQTAKKNKQEGARKKAMISGPDDPFPGGVPIPAETMKKFKRGEKIELRKIGNKNLKYRMTKMEKKYKEAQKQAASFNLLLPEEAGFLEVNEGEDTCIIDQKDIADAVDITSSSKYFNLVLDQFGPYRINYTRNGRHLLMGGRRGHVAALDWHTKQLLCEINVMESINDVRWLHSENMFAVAQKKWLYIYDNMGIELHCVKKFNDVLRMEFLPYHFLLATCSASGFLQYLDVSVGKEVTATCTKAGRLNVMAQNPYNAIIHLGHTTGTVTMWSPNVKEPLVKMLCHRGGIRAIAVDKTGTYMATSGLDKKLKIFDIRALRQVQSYVIPLGASHLTFSQSNLLAAGCGNVVHVYKDAHLEGMNKPYMCHSVRQSVHGLQFCPYEDVLGIGHGEGFTSMLVPGAGEANFDALECNPYQSKKQRQEWEVKALLEKIQPELITLDPNKLGEVDFITMKQKLTERAERLGYDPLVKEKFEPKHKMKGRSSTGNIEKRKKKVAFDRQREEIRKSVQEKAKEEKAKELRLKDRNTELGQRTALDRFRK